MGEAKRHPSRVPAVKKSLGKVLKETMLLAPRLELVRNPSPPFPAGQYREHGHIFYIFLSLPSFCVDKKANFKKGQEN
jgi:hypothetical protein